MTGIYKITNLINGHAYIGQSVNIEKRWKQEIESSNNPNDHSYEYPLMRAFRKYGFDNFSFEVIEECKVDELNQKERYWIKIYDTFFHGYNQTLGGDASSAQPKEKIIGIINDLINTDMFHKDIAAKWEISIEMVQGINTGRYWKHDTDYPLQKRKPRKQYLCKECGREISKGAQLCQKCYNKLKIINGTNSISEMTKKDGINKPNKEILLDDLLNNKGNFTVISKKYEVSPTTIRRWCKKYGLSNYSSDYKEKNTKKERKPLKIKVIQLNKETNEVISYFDSITDAAMSLGVQNHGGSHISDVCRGKRKTAYGYKWKFA